MVKIDPKERGNYIDPAAIPGVFHRHARALGDRIHQPGKERLVLAGDLLSNNQRSALAATVELPGKVLIQYGQPSRTVVFDLDKAGTAGGLNDRDEAILEMFAYDTAETMLYAIQGGTMPRVLGYAFQVKGETGFGSSVDIYEVFQRVKSRGQELRSAKQFQFDTQTALLRRISYTTLRNGSPIRVHTEYSQYEDVQSQKIAKRVVRREGGLVAMEVQIKTVQLQAKANDDAFKVH